MPAAAGNSGLGVGGLLPHPPRKSGEQPSRRRVSRSLSMELGARWGSEAQAAGPWLLAVSAPERHHTASCLKDVPCTPGSCFWQELLFVLPGPFVMCRQGLGSVRLPLSHQEAELVAVCRAACCFSNHLCPRHVAASHPRSVPLSVCPQDGSPTLTQICFLSSLQSPHTRLQLRPSAPLPEA